MVIAFVKTKNADYALNRICELIEQSVDVRLVFNKDFNFGYDLVEMILVRSFIPTELKFQSIASFNK